MVELNTPLKYHMNDLVYYLGISAGGNLGKQIAILGDIAAMAKGMLYQFQPKENSKDDPEIVSYNKSVQAIQDEIDELVDMVDSIERAYTPNLDSNPYLFNRARRVRKAIRISKVMAFNLVTKHNLISGNIMRARLVDAFGKDRIKGGGEFHNGGQDEF
jgi:hypothetical protein